MAQLMGQNAFQFVIIQKLNSLRHCKDACGGFARWQRLGESVGIT